VLIGLTNEILLLLVVNYVSVCLPLNGIKLHHQLRIIHYGSNR